MSEQPESSTSPDTPAPRRSQTRRLVVLAMLGVAMVGMALGVRELTTPSPGDGRIAWHDSFAAARKAAGETGKPMLIYFGADWCAPCVHLRKHVFTQEAVAARINGDFVPVMVDMTNPNATQSQLGQTYGAFFLPLTVLADPEGTPVARQEGAPPADVLLDWLKNNRPGSSDASPAPADAPANTAPTARGS